MLRGIYSGGVRKQNGHYQSGKSSYWKRVTVDTFETDAALVPKQFITNWDLKASSTVSGTKRIKLEYYSEAETYPYTEAVVVLEGGSITCDMAATIERQYNDELYRFRSRNPYAVLEGSEGNDYFTFGANWVFEKANDPVNPQYGWETMSRWHATQTGYTMGDPNTSSFVRPLINGQVITHNTLVLDGQVHQLMFDFNYSLRKSDFMKVPSEQEVDELAMQLFPNGYLWPVNVSIILVHDRYGSDSVPVTLYYHLTNVTS